MIARSWLFVPGDQGAKVVKALASPTDAIIIDLEDSVAADHKADARSLLAAQIGSATPDGPKIWIRINPLDTDLALPDLVHAVPARPYGIVLPKCEGPGDAIRLSLYLDALEVASGAPKGEIRILPIASETAKAALNLSGYHEAGPRLLGLTWGAEDLPAALGAASSREADGRYTPPYELVRSLCLFAASAAGVAPIDTVYPAFRDLDGLQAYANRARRDGFRGMLAIHPSQVPVINAAFGATKDEVEWARRVVQHFQANPGAGALSLDGQMIDRPHLLQAERILAQER